MASRLSRWALSASIAAAAAVSVGAAELGHYRDFRLGSSTADVAQIARTTERDITTLHQRPALLQSISWRPPYTSARVTADADPIRDVVFSFIDDRLYKIVVEYDRSRTEGLTKDDIIATLSATYGPRGTLPPRARSSTALDTATVVARWHDGDATVTLQHYEYGGGYALVVVSVPLEQAARTAQAAAVALEAREAPARANAALKKQEAEAREAAEKTRSANKEAFRP